MKTAIPRAPGDLGVETVPDPVIERPAGARTPARAQLPGLAGEVLVGP